MIVLILNADRIVRVAQHDSWEGGNMNIALTSAPFARGIETEISTN